MAHLPQANDIYRHFKGNLYRVITQAKHSETGEVLVIYQALYGDYQIYARPLSMFCSEVDHEKYPNAIQKQRFMLIPTIMPTTQGNEDIPAFSSVMTKEDNTEAAERKTAEPKEAEPCEAEPKEAEDCEAKSETAEDCEAKPETAEDCEAKPETTEPEKVEPKPVETKDVSAGAEEDRSQPEAAGSDEYTEGELQLDPLVLEFLDADSYRKKLNILAALHPRITNEMINTMAVSMDVEVEGDDVEDRLISLKTCILTKEKYECSRIR